MTRAEFFEIHNKYHLRLTGHQIWLGHNHIANLNAITMNDYRIIMFKPSKIDPSKEVFEKYVQKYILIIKQNEISKRINKIKEDF
jgi:hypothetical protein